MERRVMSLVLSLLVAVSCRQMLDLEQARVEPGASSGGGDTAGGGQLLAQGGDDADALGGTSSAATSGGGQTSSGGDAGAPPVDDGGDGGGLASAGAGGAGGPPPTLCEEYCTAMETNCTGNLVQYSDYQTCLDTCDLLPRGKKDDTGVNSVHCRLAEAEKAGRLEPDFYCPLAGPASYGKCGTSCEAFCVIMAGFCTSESTSGLYYYADEETCLADCALLPSAGEQYSAALHSIGPHFECRLFHACASNIDAEYHCGHAFGDPPCNP